MKYLITVLLYVAMSNPAQSSPQKFFRAFDLLTCTRSYCYFPTDHSGVPGILLTPEHQAVHQSLLANLIDVHDPIAQEGEFTDLFLRGMILTSGIYEHVQELAYAVNNGGSLGSQNRNLLTFVREKIPELESSLPSQPLSVLMPILVDLVLQTYPIVDFYPQKARLELINGFEPRTSLDIFPIALKDKPVFRKAALNAEQLDKLAVLDDTDHNLNTIVSSDGPADLITKVTLAIMSILLEDAAGDDLLSKRKLGIIEAAYAFKPTIETARAESRWVKILALELLLLRALDVHAIEDFDKEGFRSAVESFLRKDFEAMDLDAAPFDSDRFRSKLKGFSMTANSIFTNQNSREGQTSQVILLPRDANTSQSLLTGWANSLSVLLKDYIAYKREISRDQGGE